MFGNYLHHIVSDETWFICFCHTYKHYPIESFRSTEGSAGFFMPVANKQYQSSLLKSVNN